MKNLQKITTRLLILLTAFLAGILSFYFFTSDNKIIDTVDVVYLTPEQISENSANSQEISEARGLTPCVGETRISAKPKWNYRNRAVSTGVRNHRIMCGVLPEYPQSLKNKLSETVIVRVSINEDGEIADASVIQGRAEFRKSTIRAAHQTRFVPQLLGGQPVRVFGVIIYEFGSDGNVRLKK